MEPRHAPLGEAAQLVLVDEVLLGMPAAEEEQRGPDPVASGAQRRALLEEAAERGEARARGRS